MIQGLFQILLFQAFGELLSKFVMASIPGPVIGLLLLLAFLGWRGQVPPKIAQVGETILQHLGLLFIPASVGVMMYWPLLKAHAGAVVLALVLSVVATLGVSALVLKFMGGQRVEDEHAP
jgi:holin-like protein